MPGQLRIREFLESDLRAADGLRETAGWNQTDADWRRFLAHEPGGCFVAETDGEVVGTVTTTRHGNEVGWIGMMLVDPGFRRRGIATELMGTAMDYLRGRGVECIKLDATPEGAPVYEKLGFRAEWELCRWSGEPVSGQSVEGESFLDAASVRDMLALPMDFDTKAFGADRSEWAGRVAEGAAGMRVRRDEAGRPVAYGMWRRGRRANYLGPASAADAASGVAVIEDLLGSIDGETFWDIPEANGAAIAVAEARGFRRVRPLLRMWCGDREVRGLPELQFGLADPAAG